MKLDKKTCPILFEKLNLNKLGLKMPQESINMHNELLRPCMSKIMIITNPVLAAFDHCDVKTVKKLLNLRNEIEPISRCVIWKTRGCCETTLYTFGKAKDGIWFSILQQTTIKRGIIPIVNNHISGYWHFNDPFDLYHISLSSTVDYKEHTKEVTTSIAEISVQCEVFLQYAEIETKILKSNISGGIRCKYSNKLPFPVTIVDSTWYTNLIKSDAFKVSGHFRLQPFGEGLNKRKLIWINEFQKNGYTRIAKKIAV